MVKGFLEVALVGLVMGGWAAAQGKLSSVTLLETKAESRVVEHALGVTEVPLEPQRIVSLTLQLTDALLALGVKPVASMTYEGDFGYLNPELAGVTPLADTASYDLEALLLTDPDLILVEAYNAGLERSLYAQLSGIAPTVVLNETDTFSASLWLRDLGTLLGKEAEAEARWAEFEAHAQETKNSLQTTVGSAPVALFRVLTDSFRIYGNVGYTSVLYDYGVGLTPPDAVRELAWGRYNVPVSLEAIPELADAQYLFVSVDGDEDAQAVFAELEENPLWRALPAVKAGHVYPVDRRIWMNNGVLASDLKLDQLAVDLGGTRE